jgi:hypothetical protein
MSSTGMPTSFNSFQPQTFRQDDVSYGESLGQPNYGALVDGQSHQQMETEQLQIMYDYASIQACRRRYLLSYFGESLETGSDGAFCCDNCREYLKSVKLRVDNTVDEGQDDAHLQHNTVDVRCELILLLHTVRYASSGYHGIGVCLQLLCGSHSQVLTQKLGPSYARAITFGRGKHRCEKWWKALVNFCVCRGEHKFLESSLLKGGGFSFERYITYLDHLIIFAFGNQVWSSCLDTRCRSGAFSGWHAKLTVHIWSIWQPRTNKLSYSRSPSYSRNKPVTHIPQRQHPSGHMGSYSSRNQYWNLTTLWRQKK